MAVKLSKVYEPGQYESDIYALWEKSGAFTPKNRGSKQNYSIVMPPPNANANLHIGYELTTALEDIAARYHRQKGEATLLLPGADHAGFETWVVYEKLLAKTGKSRFDFSREELYKQVWDFVAQNRENFEAQLRRMGASCDWTRYTFTLDEKIVQRAYATFKKMWDESLIYRGERLVNFCTFHGTAFADIEVAYKQEKGKLWYLTYPLTDGSGEVVVATTRPETMLGDTAVAVNPNDKRYKDLIGKTVQLPLAGREVPVIVDDFVDMSFGTGAVKITPAHDPNDFEVAERHNLPKITVIDHEGKLTSDTPKAYRGLSVKDARDQVVRDLEEQGALAKTESITHSVGHCYKCDTVIEPLLRDQWFIDMQPLAARAIKALKAGKIHFYPASKKDQLITYLQQLRDWNISRQIAWGIPIPAFQNVDDYDDWIYDERVNQETITKDDKTYRRDPDVFDTWFSSSSWPYATLDYPDSIDYKAFYPLNLMETGGEILYPWVSRMIMLGLYVTDEVPFTAVYIHGYVMAEDGSKMSKSLGNVVDPLPIIAKYGSDALRMGIIAGRVPVVNRGYDPRKVEDARNFCNKLWNIARYIEDRVGDNAHLRHNPAPSSPADHWILTKLQHITEVISKDLDNYRFAEAYEQLYHFVWDDLADWYIEATKSEDNHGMLSYSLETTLKLVHPFAPFLTETIWQTLKWEADSMLAISPWPSVPNADTKQGRAFEQVKQLVSEVRYLKTALKLKDVTLSYASSELDKHIELMKRLANLQAVQQQPNSEGLKLTTVPFDCWLQVDKATTARYASELQQRLKAQEKVIDQFKKRLANKAYVAQAPPSIVEETRSQLAEAETQLATLTKERKRFI